MKEYNPHQTAPRMTFEITREQKKILDKHLHHGERKAIMSIIITDLCLLLEKNTFEVKSAILSRQLTLKKLLRMGEE